MHKRRIAAPSWSGSRAALQIKTHFVCITFPLAGLTPPSLSPIFRNNSKKLSAHNCVKINNNYCCNVAYEAVQR